jgi:hypothetical protein
MQCRLHNTCMQPFVLTDRGVLLVRGCTVRIALLSICIEAGLQEVQLVLCRPDWLSKQATSELKAEISCNKFDGM